jgi:acyl transferase domain-containing protein
MSLPLQIFVLSAPSAEDLKNCALVAADWLEGPGATLPIADVAYSSAKTLPNKLNHPYRLAVLGDSSEDISFKLRNDHYVSGFLPNGTSPPQLCFLFAAFGSTYADMGNELYKAFSAYRDNLDEWMNLCGEVKDVSFSEAVLHDGVMKKNLVPMVMTGDSLRALWNSWGIYPNISLGHSVGEFMASLASGKTSKSRLKYFNCI